MTPHPHPAPDDEIGDPLHDVEASLLAIEGLFEAVCELSANSDPKDRRMSAICAVSGHLLDETGRARQALQRAFERRHEDRLHR